MNNSLYYLFAFLLISMLSCKNSDETFDSVPDFPDKTLIYKLSALYDSTSQGRMELEYNANGKVSRVYEVTPELERETAMNYKYDNNCVYTHIKQVSKYNNPPKWENTDTIYLKNGIADSCSGVFDYYARNKVPYYIKYEYDSENRMTNMKIVYPPRHISYERERVENYSLEWEGDNIKRITGTNPQSFEYIYEYYDNSAIPSHYVQRHPVLVHHQPLIEENVFGKKSSHLIYSEKRGENSIITYDYEYANNYVNAININYNNGTDICKMSLKWMLLE